MASSSGNSASKKQPLGTPNIQSVARTLDILEAMKQEARGQSLAELGRHVNLHRATIHRILTTLERRGYVEQNQVTRRYHLGLRLLELGSAYWNQNDLTRLGQPVLDRVTADTGHTSYLGILDRHQFVIVAVAYLGLGLKVVTRVGNHRPIHATAGGKMLLACLSDDMLDAFLSTHRFTFVTQNTITSSAVLRQELEIVRQRGYAMNHEESIPGVTGVAVPVRDPAGQVRAALAMLWPTNTVSPQRESELLNYVVESARRLTNDWTRGNGTV